MRSNTQIILNVSILQTCRLASVMDHFQRTTTQVIIFSVKDGNLSSATLRGQHSLAMCQRI